jgi:deoxyribonuclease-4
MKLGAHVSIVGGVDKAIDRAASIRAECIQIFSGAPIAWKRKTYSEEELGTYRQKVQSTGIEPAFIHAPYLVNLATDVDDILARSVDALVADMRAAHLLGALGVVVHLGSHAPAGWDERFGQVIAACSRILAATPDDTWLILENRAAVGQIGSTLAELGVIVRAVASERIKICLDTQHAWAVGYDLKTSAGLSVTLEEFAQAIGLERLVLVHANDSGCPMGARLDRHENIGQGSIGLDGFTNLMSRSELEAVPFVLEVPGFDGDGPDARNVELLKAIWTEVHETGQEAL